MENWKIIAIAACLGVPVLFGIYQEKQSQTPATPDSETSAEPQPTATPPAFFGKTLPEWKIPASDWINSPKAITQADLRGKVSLLEIFRINCSHCQDVAPLMEGLYRRYKPRQMNMVALQSPGRVDDATNSENDLPAVKAWIGTQKLTYPIGHDAGSVYFQNTLKGTLYPTTIILDKNGKVIFHQTGHDQAKGIRLAGTLEKLLPGPGTPQARATNLATFLRTYPEYQSAGQDLDKALQDVIAAS